MKFGASLLNLRGLLDLCCSTFMYWSSCSCFRYLANLESKHLLEVRGLADEKQVESPASAEISHDDGVHWHGREEGPPGGVKFL